MYTPFENGSLVSVVIFCSFLHHSCCDVIMKYKMKATDKYEIYGTSRLLCVTSVSAHELKQSPHGRFVWLISFLE